MEQILLWASPVFAACVALEFWFSRSRVGYYTLADTVNSMSLGLLYQISGALGTLLTVGIYALVYEQLAWFRAPEFWSTWYGFLLALVFYDFCYYWLHRMGHEVAVLWAAHVVHHQSQHYNLSTALRQTSSGVALSWIFYLPMALAGVPPEVFLIVALVDLFYQFWVHTEMVGKLGWFDRVFCSPSNHRVHHAVNDRYVDRNYGGVLVLWDRLFGSFQEETEPCVYGTRSPLNSWDPLWANAQVYWHLARLSMATRRWRDKVRVWFMPPGWLPADLAHSHAPPPFLVDPQSRFNPPLGRSQIAFVAAQFAALTGGMSVYLLHVAQLPTMDAALYASGLVAALWALGRYMQQGLQAWEVLAVELAAWASLSAVQLLPWHTLTKPAVMALALLVLARHAHSAQPAARRWTRNTTLLMAALGFALVGDILLMLPGDYFVQGLAAFLAVHLLYLALLRSDAPWFAHRPTLCVALALGAAIYAVLWSHLQGGVLPWAVLVYISAISLMTAQALGRAHALGTPAARRVALGACLFMASDALIAFDRFLSPLPLAQFWVLASYFAAQLLIVNGLQDKPRHLAEL